MRNPFKRQSHLAEKPTLQERAAALKISMARLIHGQHRVDLTDQPSSASLPQGSVEDRSATTFIDPHLTRHDVGRGDPNSSGCTIAADGHAPRQESAMGRHESFGPINATPFSLGTMGGALPAPGSPEALEAFGAACRAVDAASRLSATEMEALHIVPGGASLWTSDTVTAALSGKFSRFLPREIEAARATPQARLEELQILALRRELRMAEAARASRIRELHALVYGDEPDPADEDEAPVQAGADPRLVAMVEEWQEARRKLNDPSFPDGPEADAMCEGHSLRQRKIYLYPARSVLDLLAKVPVLGDELADATRDYDNDRLPKDLSHAAWAGLLADIERIAGHALAAPANNLPDSADEDLCALAGPWEAARRLYDQRTEEQNAIDRAALLHSSHPGEAPQGAGPDWDDWRRRLTEYREKTGIDDAEAASTEALTELCDIEDRIAALPARTLIGLQIKARVAERNSSIDVEWPQGLGDGLVQDLLSLTGDAATQPERDLGREAFHYARGLDVSAVPFENLWRLYEVFSGVYEHLSAGQGEAMFNLSKPGQWRRPTPGGTILDAEINRFGCLRDVFVRELERRLPRDVSERDARLEILVRHEMQCEGGIRDKALLAEVSAAWGA